MEGCLIPVGLIFRFGGCGVSVKVAGSSWVMSPRVSPGFLTLNSCELAEPPEPQLVKS